MYIYPYLYIIFHASSISKNTKSIFFSNFPVTLSSIHKRSSLGPNVSLYLYLEYIRTILDRKLDELFNFKVSNQKYLPHIFKYLIFSLWGIPNLSRGSGFSYIKSNRVIEFSNVYLWSLPTYSKLFYFKYLWIPNRTWSKPTHVHLC